MSASESILTDEKSKQQFSGFRASAEFVQIPHVTDERDDYRLAHGHVATFSQDVAVNHAWVEEIDFVCAFCDGHKRLFSRDGYYKSHKIYSVRTYTAQEAITLIGIYGHWGSWN